MGLEGTLCFHNIYSDLVRDIFELADHVASELANQEHILCKTEELIEVFEITVTENSAEDTPGPGHLV